ncbi:protein Son-like [Styela clava]
MTMANDEQKIDDVDEMFEAFVKKKLQQLGIKRAASKNVENGAMSELELNMKLRLEKNLGSKVNELEEKKVEVDEDDQSNDWVESFPKVKKNKKEKKDKKKKKKKDKKESKYDSRKNKTGRNQSEPVELNTEDKILDKAKDPEAGIDHKTNLDLKNGKSTIELNSKSDKKTEHVTTIGPKKDIATIKMKIELLKAKSEGERLKKEANGLLKSVSKNQSSVGNEKNENEKNKHSENEDNGDRKSNSRSPSRRLKHLHQSRSRSRSRSPKKSSRRSKSKSRSPVKRSKRHRSRSRSRSRSRRRRGHRSRSYDKHRRSRSRSRERRHRKRSRRSSSPRITTKDKVRLLEIAKANALAQHKASHNAASVTSMGALLKSGSMSVNQLTEICKDIVNKKEPTIVDKDEILTKEKAEEYIKKSKEATVHHPFAVRETPISFNIKPVRMGTPAPPPVIKALSTLTKEFPVSCGQQHRRKEVLETVYGKWETIAKDEATKNAVKELVTSDKVFMDETEPLEVDLSSAIADRISAVRQLQDNPTNIKAQEKMEQAQKQLDTWTKKKQTPGQFTGHTGLTPMPKEVLESGKQAWFKADDVKNAKKVGGIGKSLLEKMGWTPGTPLGKTMMGQLEPLQLDMKNDRRGLSSFMETLPSTASSKKARVANGPKPVMDLSGKHPVSALMEICSKRHWNPPDFRLADPCNIKNFTYRVTVCNDEYIGHPANNKKQAKYSAATVALQCMGLVPKET